MADHTLDARNLLCPMPVLKARKAITGLAKEQTLEVLATDPGSVADFKAFCQSTGHTLVESGQDAGVYRFLIRRMA